MRLAEALILRADLNKRLAQLKERANRVVTYQEGESPTELPEKIIAEHEGACHELESLIARINRTNLAVRLPNGSTMTDALAHRDLLRVKLDFYRSLTDTATKRNFRIARAEIRTLLAVNVPQIQRTIDDLAKEYRLLETDIQAANWANELVE